MAKVIDQELFLQLLSAARTNLENNKQKVNDLNVFPVPDGDTGTNMSLTIQHALKECAESKASALFESVSAASNGALMGARGNSGVILSQLFRGFSRALKGLQTAGVADIVSAMKSATEMAYKAVMKPTEGTILTVAREMSENAAANADSYESIEDLLFDALRAGQISLDNTPNLLPVLKEAGVVDAGGQGLLYIIEGALQALAETGENVREIASRAYALRRDGIPGIESGSEYTYCAEFMVAVTDGANHEKFLIDRLVKLGGSLLVSQDDASIMVHLQTNEPWTAMKLAAGFGELTGIKIENLNSVRQGRPAAPSPSSPAHQGEAAKEAKKAEIAVIAVCYGEGLNEILRDLGVDYIISGGQTMNPSTQDFVDVIESASARHYIILPDNKNIILAAQQAAALSDKDVRVIPTTTIPEAISALMEFDANLSLEDNMTAMLKATGNVKTAQITFAVRDSSVGNVRIKKGDVIGILAGEVAICENNLADAVVASANRLADEKTELITLYYGEDVSASDAEEIGRLVSDAFPEKDVQVFSGGQPLYYFIMSAE